MWTVSGDGERVWTVSGVCNVVDVYIKVHYHLLPNIIKCKHPCHIQYSVCIHNQALSSR